MSVDVLHGDCRQVLASLPERHFHGCLTDPPYELGMMNKAWDRTGVAFQPETWAAVLRTMRPGAVLMAFGGTRTFHRMAWAIEDGGFEVFDTFCWLYGSGFPKSHDVAKAIDKARRRDFVIAALELGLNVPARNITDWTKEDHSPGDKWWAEFKAAIPAEQWQAIERRVTGSSKSGDSSWFAAGRGDLTVAATTEAAAWEGYGTAVKPAWEPIIVARRPIEGTYAANVLRWGCGALHIDACRIDCADDTPVTFEHGPGERSREQYRTGTCVGGAFPSGKGRWPANVQISRPENQYLLRSEVTAEQRREVFRWLHENP